MGFSAFPATTESVASGPVTLGYAQVTTGQTGITSLTDLNGLSVTVTVPAGRRLKISAWAQYEIVTSAGAAYGQILRNNIEVGRWLYTDAKPVGHHTEASSFIDTPSAGTHTYKLNLGKWNGGGTINLIAGAALPAYILVEDITGDPEPFTAASVPVGQLGHAVVTSSTSSTSAVDIPALAVNVVVPAGRTLRVTATSHMQNSVVGGAGIGIKQDGVLLKDSYGYSTHAGSGFDVVTTLIVSPSAGSHTYQARLIPLHGGNCTQFASSALPAYITVEDVTPTPVPTSSAASSTLGYAEITSGGPVVYQATTDIPGASTTVTVPAGRRLRITGYTYVENNNAGATVAAFLEIREGGTRLHFDQQALVQNAAGAGNGILNASVVISPSAGMHTYKLRLGASSNVNWYAGPTYPTYILVEDITGVGVPIHDHDAAPTSTLAYAEVTANQTGMTGTHDLEGLSVTVTVAAGRRLRISGFGRATNSVANNGFGIAIYEGAAVLTTDSARFPAANEQQTLTPSVVVTPSEGTHTYNLRGVVQGGGTATLWAASSYPAYIMVEDITGFGVPGHTHSQLDQLTDSGWATLPLLNGWVSYDNNYGPPRYRKVNGIVYVQGLIKSGTLGVTVAQLPVGFRPSLPKLLFAIERNSNVIGRADVQSDGHIIGALFDQGWTSLAGIIFPADQ